MESKIPEWIKDIDTLLSILGFAITVGVFFRVEGIRKHFLRRARMPELSKNLTAASSKYSESLNNWPALQKDAHYELMTALPLLRIASSMTKRRDSPEIHSALKTIKKALKHFSTSTSYDEAWTLYVEMQSALTSMNQLKKNMKWE